MLKVKTSRDAKQWQCELVASDHTRMCLKYAALFVFPVFLPDKSDEEDEVDCDTKVFTHKIKILVPNIEEILSK